MIGGNSILAIKLANVISKSSSLRINVSDIFKYKNIQGLISKVDSNEIVIPKLSIDKAKLSFAQERLLFIEEYEQGSNAYHIPMLLELISVDKELLRKV